MHVTKPPPPLPEPTHCSIDMGKAALSVDAESTVQRTRRVEPPPVPASLHCVTVAFVVVAGKGLHAMVGSVPPPVPAVLHWFTVTGDVVAAPVMLFVMSTLHVTVPPPPLPEPLHWSTTVMTSAELKGVMVQVGAAFAAPWHSRIVPLELVTPVVRLMLFVTVKVHSTAWPPTLSVPLHWFTAMGAARATAGAGAAPTADASIGAAGAAAGAR